MSEPGAARASGLAVAFAIDLAAAIAFALAALMLCGFAWAATHDLGQGAAGARRLVMPGPLAEVLSTIAAMAAAAAGLLFWRRRPSPEEWRRSFAAARRPSTWGWAVVAAGLLAGVVAAIGGLGSASGLQVQPSNEALLRALARTHPGLLWAFAAGIAPVCEEVVFRRVVFGRFEAAGLPRTGVLASAALYAFLHEIPGAGPGPWAVSLLLWLVYATMGVAFALVYRRCGTLWAAILAHALHNVAGLLLL